MHVATGESALQAIRIRPKSGRQRPCTAKLRDSREAGVARVRRGRMSRRRWDQQSSEGLGRGKPYKLLGGLGFILG